MVDFSFEKLEHYKETYFVTNGKTVTMWIIFHKEVPYKQILASLPHYLHSIGNWGHSVNSIYCDLCKKH